MVLFYLWYYFIYGIILFMVFFIRCNTSLLNGSVKRCRPTFFSWGMELAVSTTAPSPLRRFSPSASKCACGCGGCRGHTARG